MRTRAQASVLAKSLLAIGALLLAPAPTWAGPIHLVPHEATYDLSLSRAEPGGVVGARGEMSYKLEGTCTGWTMETRTALTLNYAEGNEVETLWEFVAFEARDGSDYTFFIRNTHNGAVQEVLEGAAALNGVPPVGSARFRKPRPDSVSLPSGTLFPNAHTIAILEAARKGERFIGRPVFDGGSEEGPSLVSAAIGAPLAADPKSAKVDDLLKTPSWRMSIAFFPPPSTTEGESGEGTPSYEVNVRYHDNGVAQDMIQDFGFFSLTSRLRTLKRLPEPDC
ncbi:cell envelope integrity EipB family protein [Pararhodospirillum photometricum]|nr:cell envelope integrity EipB family protein [Pararhodospirillum photometricum]